MPGSGTLQLDLRRPEAAVLRGLTGEGAQPLRSFSDAAWRRAQAAAVNAHAYALFAALAAQTPALAYRGVPLLPLLQRHLTEALVQTWEQVILVQGMLEAERPRHVHAVDARTARLTRLAAARAGQQLLVTQPGGAERNWQRGARTVLASTARSALLWRRIRPLLAQKPAMPPPEPGRPRVLFLPYYPNHLPSFLPLIEALLAAGRSDVWVSGADTNTLRAGDVDPAPLAPLGVPYVPFEAAVSPAELRASLWRSQRLARRLAAAARAADFWTAVSLDADTLGVIRPLLADLLDSRLPKVLLYLDLAAALLAALRPALVVVTDETLPILGRVALRSAQQQGAATLTIQHGLLLPDPMYFGPAVADRMAVWGTQSRDFLAAHGCPPERLVVVGATRFDRPPADLAPLDLAALLGLPDGTRVVLFTSQPGGRDVSPAANLATFTALAAAVAATPGCHLLVKPHPAQTDAELAAWRQAAAGAPVSVRRELPLHPAMLGAALCVTVFSTTGLEAMWLDRPLLTLNLTDRPEPIAYAAAAVAADRAEAVLPALRQALDPADQAARQAARRAFAERYLGPLDGRALQRLVQVIEGMVGQAP